MKEYKLNGIGETQVGFWDCDLLGPLYAGILNVTSFLLYPSLDPPEKTLSTSYLEDKKSGARILEP